MNILDVLSYVPSEATYNKIYNTILRDIEARDKNPKSKIAAEEAKRIVDYVYLMNPNIYPNPKRIETTSETK